MCEMKELYELCENVKNLVKIDNYSGCRTMIGKAMAEYPDAAEPHNLLGIIMEKQGNHAGAMKHFRAAWALDPSYIPARENMERFGTFEAAAEPVFSEKDCRVKVKRSFFKLVTTYKAGIYNDII